MVLVYPLTMSKIVGTDIFHAAALLWVAGIGHLVSGNVDLHATAWLLTGSIPGVLLSSRFTVRLPDIILRLSLGTILVLSGIKLLNVPAAQWILLGGLIALAMGLTAYGLRAWARAAAGSPPRARDAARPVPRRHLAQAGGRAPARRVQVARRARHARGAEARRRRDGVDRQSRRRDGVGRAARRGARAIVFVPEQASAAKVALIEAQGAELRRAGADMDEAKAAARELAEREGWFFFEDGAEPAQFDGYAAIGDELLDQLAEPPGSVVVPVGNGALAIGVFRALAARAPDDRAGRGLGRGRAGDVGELARAAAPSTPRALRRLPTASRSGSRSRSPSPS